MGFEKKAGIWAASLIQQNARASRDLEIFFPNQRREFIHVATGLQYPNRRYFTLTKPITSQEAKSLPAPKKICVLWDQSQSGEGRDIAAEIDFLQKKLGSSSAEEFRLVTFNNELRIDTAFKNIGALTQMIKSLPMDGGTQLGVLDLTQYDAEQYFLFTDGLSNIGDSQIKTGIAPVVSVSSSVNASSVYLRYIANKTSGHYINLMESGWEKMDLNTIPYQFLYAIYENAEASEVFPSASLPIENGQIQVSGILKAEETTIRLHFGWSRQEIHHIEEIKIKAGKPIPEGLVEHIWANEKLTELERSSLDHQDSMLAVATTYGIVTPQTSLIVLDEMADYRRYGIKPPASMIRKAGLDPKEWDTAARQYQKLKKVPNYLLNRWLGRIKWYGQAKVWTTGQGKEVSPESIKQALLDMSGDEYYADDAFGGGDAFGDDGDWGDEEEEAAPSSGGDDLRREASKASGKKKGKKAKIELAPWSPQSPYVKELMSLPSERRYAHYLQIRDQYRSNTGFYADVADFFLHQGDTNTALLIASNIAELQLENHEMLRLLASMLKLCDRYDLAVLTHEQIAKLRPDEIQSFRDLALTYEANAQYQKALEAFNDALLTRWTKVSLRADHGGGFGQGGWGEGWGDDDGFGDDENEPTEREEVPGRAVIGTQEVILGEINHLIYHHGDQLDLSSVDSRIIKNLPVDVRVVVDWDSDNFDMDLWVTDPSGEKCYYANRSTDDLGRYTYDNTTGYGPEEFMVKDAAVGEYHVQMNYYGTRSQKMLAPVTVTVHFFTFYGTGDEQHQQIVLRLGDRKEVVEAGKLKFSLNLEEITKSISQEPQRYREIKLPALPLSYAIDPSGQYVVSLSESIKDDSSKQTVQSLTWIELPSLKTVLSKPLEQSSPYSHYPRMKVSGDTIRLLRLDLHRMEQLISEADWPDGGNDTVANPYFYHTVEYWSISQKKKLGNMVAAVDSILPKDLPVKEFDMSIDDNADAISYQVELVGSDGIWITESRDYSDKPMTHHVQQGSQEKVTLADRYSMICGDYLVAHKKDSVFTYHLPTATSGRYLVKGFDRRGQFFLSDAAIGIMHREVMDVLKIHPRSLEHLGTIYTTGTGDLPVSIRGKSVLLAGGQEFDPRGYRPFNVQVSDFGHAAPKLVYYHPVEVALSPNMDDQYLVSIDRDTTLRFRHLDGLADRAEQVGFPPSSELAYYKYKSTLVVIEQESLIKNLPSGLPISHTSHYTLTDDGQYSLVGSYQAGKDYHQILVLDTEASLRSVYEDSSLISETWQRYHQQWIGYGEGGAYGYSDQYLPVSTSALYWSSYNESGGSLARMDLERLELALARFRTDWVKLFAASNEKKHPAHWLSKKLEKKQRVFDRDHGFKLPEEAEGWLSKGFAEYNSMTVIDGWRIKSLGVSPSNRILAALVKTDSADQCQITFLTEKLDLKLNNLTVPYTEGQEVSFASSEWLISHRSVKSVQENFLEKVKGSRLDWLYHLPSATLVQPPTSMTTGLITEQRQWSNELLAVDKNRIAFLAHKKDSMYIHIWDAGQTYRVPFVKPAPVTPEERKMFGQIVAHEYGTRRLELVQGTSVVAYEQQKDWVFYDYQAKKVIARIPIFLSHGENNWGNAVLLQDDDLAVVGIGKKVFVQNWRKDKTVDQIKLPSIEPIKAIDIMDTRLVTLHTDLSIKLWESNDTGNAKCLGTYFLSDEQCNDIKLTKKADVIEIQARRKDASNRVQRIYTWVVGR